MAFTRTDGSQHYTDGRGFRTLGDEEKALLAEHVPAPEDGRALEACCGTGKLAVFLNTMGYTVDAVDFAEGALGRARSEHAETDGCAGGAWTSSTTTSSAWTRTATT